MNEIENFLPISLPSKCLTYDGIKPDDIKIRAYQGRDEIFLAEINPINLEQKYLHVLKNVVQGIDPARLTLGDRLYIMIWEYAKSYSETITVKTVCSYCLKEVEVVVNLGELNVITLPDGFKQPFHVSLPDGTSVNLRLLTIADEIEAEKFEEKSNEGLLFRYARSIVSDQNILQRMEKLSTTGTKCTSMIRAFHEKFYHGPEMKYNFNCPNTQCGRGDVVDVPFRLDFVFPSNKTIASDFGTRI